MPLEVEEISKVLLIEGNVHPLEKGDKVMIDYNFPLVSFVTSNGDRLDVEHTTNKIVTDHDRSKVLEIISAATGCRLRLVRRENNFNFDVWELI